MSAEQGTGNVFGQHKNSEWLMFESLKTPETWIGFSGQFYHGLSDGVPGMSQDITPPFSLSIFHLSFIITGTQRVQGVILKCSITKEEKVKMRKN